MGRRPDTRQPQLTRLTAAYREPEGRPKPPEGDRPIVLSIATAATLGLLPTVAVLPDSVGRPPLSSEEATTDQVQATKPTIAALPGGRIMPGILP